MQERRRELTEAAGAAYYDNDLVVSKPDGAPYRRDAMSTAFGQLIRHLEMPHIRFHDLRHPYVKLTTNNICIPYTLKSLTLYAISMRFWGNTYTFSISKSTMELVRPSA